MKRLLSFVFVCLLCLSLCSCGSNVKNAKILQVKSELYSQEDIEKAVNTVIRRFDMRMNNCILNEICYAGDDVTTEHQEWADRYDADEAIVLDSEFFVQRSDGAASLNEGSTYYWIWILVRTSGGKWKLVDYGFK